MLGSPSAYSVYAVKGDTGLVLPRAHPGGGAGGALMTMSRVFAHYLWLWVWPRTLLADYSRDAFPASTGIADPVGAAALALHAALVWATWRAARSGSALGLAGLCFYVTLAPVSQIVPHPEMMAEHYLYLPSVWLSLVTGVALARLRVPGGPLRDGLVLLVLSLLTIRTVSRNADWTDSRTLWSVTVRDAPRCARAQTNLALSLWAAGDEPEAIEAYERSLAIDPDDPYTLNNYGSSLLEAGRLDEAISKIRRAVAIHARYREAWNNLGAALRQKGYLARSEDALRRAIALEPDYVHALNNLGLTLKARGRLEEAVAVFQRALQIDPTSIEAANNIALVLTDGGKPREALGWLGRALAREPSNPVLLVNLARTHLAAGDPPAARKAYREAQRLGVRDADLEARLGAEPGR
jgi:Tfp pilus assembly protein PilF